VNRHRIGRTLAGAGLVVVSTLVYGHGLAAPALQPEEHQVEAQAFIVAEHWSHDRDGRRQPLFVRVDGDRWLAPLPVYTTAVLIMLAPSASIHVRWTAVVFGVTDVLLLCVLGIRCFQRTAVGFAAALILLFTPSHVLFSRTAMVEGIWPLPFILGWAIGLTALTDRPSPRSRWIVAAGIGSLLASASAQASAALMMPMFGIVTIVMFRQADGWRTGDTLPASAIFAAALLPLLLFFRGTYVATLHRWMLQPAYVRNPVAWLRAVSWHRVATVSKWFWDFFLPSHLFVTPGAPGLCGMFLSAMVVPIAVGVHALIRHAGAENGTLERMRPVIAAGCIVGPLAAAMSGHPPLDGRALTVVPFGVLLAMWGSTVIWRGRGVVGRVILVTTAVVAAIQLLSLLDRYTARYESFVPVARIERSAV